MIRDEFGWQRGKINDVRSVMKKKTTGTSLALSLAVIYLIGCGVKTNLDNDPQFKPMIGKVLKTKKDLVVIDFKGGKKSPSLALPETSGVPAIKDIPTQLPADYYDAVVYGLFPAGSTIQIAHIELAKSFEFSITDFYVDVISEGKFKGQRFEIGSLTNQNTPIPTIDEKYLEEITPVEPLPAELPKTRK